MRALINTAKDAGYFPVHVILAFVLFLSFSITGLWSPGGGQPDWWPRIAYSHCTLWWVLFFVPIAWDLFGYQLVLLVKYRTRRQRGWWMEANSIFHFKWPLSKDHPIQSPNTANVMPSSQLVAGCSLGHSDWKTGVTPKSPERCSPHLSQRG